MECQTEFLFADGPAPEWHLPDPRTAFLAEVAAAWQLPISQRIQVELSGHAFVGLRGRLELARAPDLPLDPHHPLALRIGEVEFSSRQIAGWALE